MNTVYKRELRSYQYSMIGYVFIALLLLVIGIFFMSINMFSGYPVFGVTLANVQFIFLIIIPLLTMRSFSEEIKQKTDQMLLTAPVGIWKIVWGKYLAMVTVFAVPMAVSCLFPLIIKAVGKGYFLIDYSAIFAFFIMGCLFISIGMYLSSLTENQMIAATSTFGVMLLMFLWSNLLRFLPVSALGSFICFVLVLIGIALLIGNSTKNKFAAVVILIVGIIVLGLIVIMKNQLLENLFPNLLENLEMFGVFNNFTGNEIFDIQGLFKYISITFLFIFLTVQSIQKRRWS